MSEEKSRNSEKKSIRGPAGFGGQRVGSQRPKGPLGYGPPGAHFQIQGEKPRNFRATMTKFIKYISEFKAAVLVVIVFAISSTEFAIVGPKIIARVTKEL